jgi:uncharacterized protein YdiU (UPF0061 family)
LLRATGVSLRRGQARAARPSAAGLAPPLTRAPTPNPCLHTFPLPIPPQWAIDAAEQGDYSELEALMALLSAPYDEHPGADPKYTAPPPPELAGKPGVCMLSCSS